MAVRLRGPVAEFCCRPEIDLSRVRSGLHEKTFLIALIGLLSSHIQAPVEAEMALIQEFRGLLRVTLSACPVCTCMETLAIVRRSHREIPCSILTSSSP
eukprot:COSAG02_NODE_345_length_24135_cov_6.425404_16_plen_99_part_00